MSPATLNLEKIKNGYLQVKELAKKDISSEATGKALHDLAITSLAFLSEFCEPVALKSLVPGKEYISFKSKSAQVGLTRPANKKLFINDAKQVSAHWDSWLQGKISKENLASMSYTIALAPCLAMEIFDRGNKKGPATYFECLIGHLFAKSIGVNPHRDASLQVKDEKIRMTMDFLFDYKAKGIKIHLPVKMSTRERVVQAWAHHRLLDAYYGVGAYKGIMVLFSETKLDLKKKEVVEIAVPDQWLAYQAHLSKMDRIYYFDVPVRYQALTDKFPEFLPIKQFGEFFLEKDTLFDPKKTA